MNFQVATRKHPSPSESANRRKRSAPVALRPALVVMSQDQSILAIAANAGSDQWRVESRVPAIDNRELLALQNVRIVIFDDELVEPSDHGWMLAQIRRCAPQAAIIYVAGNHNWDTERQARTGGAQYYCSKPIDYTIFSEVLKSFLRVAR